MKIESIRIENYKSIKYLELPFLSYGKGEKELSRATFLVGLNECGKTAILEAIHLSRAGLEDINYDDCCFKAAYEGSEYIDIYLQLHLEKPAEIRKTILSLCKIPQELVNKIHFLTIERNVYRKPDSIGFQYIVEIQEIDVFGYLVETLINDDGSEEKLVKEIKSANSVSEKILKSNVETFLKDGQDLLTKEILEEIISEKLVDYFEENLPEIQIWKPEPEYLINEPIDLLLFKEDTSISIPLRNMFHIYGRKSDDEIKMAIERALSKQERCDELKDKLSESVTKHLNRIWKEHKVKVIVSINGTLCQVFVEDKDKKHSYYKMEQRSAGFKQFISLILSLSALNESQSLKNDVILIDEPEVHLHPSGVRYMRDEIIKIGKNNQLFVSTHSHYMVDTSCPERHWIVQKQKSETSIQQIGEETPIEDDEVLASAFGLNLFKELLPKNIIVVEGKEDRDVLLHSLNILETRFFYTIKSAGGASKMPGIASLLNSESVPAYFLFDDDKEGRDNKKRIIENHKESFDSLNVFTLRDLEENLPKDSTLEDLYPLDFIKEFFEQALKQEFTFDGKEAVINQLKQQNHQIRTEKAKLESLKVKLSKDFIKSFNTVEKLNAKCPILTKVINLLLKKME